MTPQPNTPRKHTEAEYLAFDPGAGDDFPAAVEFRKTALVMTRKEHQCYGTGAGKQHVIQPGTRVYRETGKCEGHTGTVYICLPCLDFLLEPERW
jgi:hypothetical protein